MLVHFDDLFTTAEDNKITARRHITLSALKLVPDDVVPEGTEINGHALSGLQGRLLRVEIDDSSMIIKEIADEILD